MAIDSATLQILLDLAESKVSARAAVVTRAEAEHARGASTLATLTDHRTESRGHFDRAMALGMDVATLRNHQMFLARMDAAIIQQQTAVSSLQANLHSARLNLAEEQRKRLGYSLLEKRAVDEAQATANKRDQKQMDEFAANATRRAQ